MYVFYLLEPCVNIWKIFFIYIYIYMVEFWLSKISKEILVLVFSNFNFVFWLQVWHGPIVKFKNKK
jgi:hypothetical protein